MTEEEMEQLQTTQTEQIIQVFLQYDHEHRDEISHNDFKLAMEALGECITEKMQYQMLQEADPTNKGYIDYISFRAAVEKKRAGEQRSSKAELLDAFIAMGGEEDGDGSIDADLLVKIIKHDFQMTIDIEALILEIDEDGSGEIEFDEFKALLQSKSGNQVDPTEIDSDEETRSAGSVEKRSE